MKMFSIFAVVLTLFVTTNLVADNLPTPYTGNPGDRDGYVDYRVLKEQVDQNTQAIEQIQAYLGLTQVSVAQPVASPAQACVILADGTTHCGQTTTTVRRSVLPATSRSIPSVPVASYSYAVGEPVFDDWTVGNFTESYEVKFGQPVDQRVYRKKPLRTAFKRWRCRGCN